MFYFLPDPADPPEISFWKILPRLALLLILLKVLLLANNLVSCKQSPQSFTKFVKATSMSKTGKKPANSHGGASADWAGDVENFVATQLELVQQECAAEEQQTKTEQAESTLKQLESKGVALLSLTITEKKAGLGGRTLLTLERIRGGVTGPLPAHRFSNGDIVALRDTSVSGAATQPRQDDRCSRTASLTADFLAASILLRMLFLGDEIMQQIILAGRTPVVPTNHQYSLSDSPPQRAARPCRPTKSRGP